MHELVLVNGILEAVRRFARERNGRVKSFKVSVGEVAGFNIELIRELLERMRDDAGLGDASIIVEIEDGMIRCNACNSLWGLRDAIAGLDDIDREMIHFIPELVSTYTRCPKCGGRDLKIVSGRGIKVDYVELIHL